MPSIDSKSKALVVGLGNIGLSFDLDSGNSDSVFSHTKAYLKHDQFELIAGVDTRQDKREAFEQFAKAPAYASIAEVIADGSRPDIVSICTPTAKRHETLKEVLELRPKTIVLEKPVAITLSEAIQIKEMCRQSGVHVFVNYMRRVDPFFREIGNMVQSSPPLCVSIRYSGGLLNNGSHFVDLMRFYFGEPHRLTPLTRVPRSDGDDAHSFVLHFKDTIVTFQSVEGTEYTLGEIDFYCKSRVLQIRDWGFEYEELSLTPHPEFPELSTLSKGSSKIRPSLENYMSSVLDYISESSESLGLAGLDSSITTLSICEEISDASK